MGRDRFEIVDTHYPDWRFNGADAVADFGLHARLVIGTPWQVALKSPEHLVATLNGLSVILRDNRGFIARGEGRNALGNPLFAVGRLNDVLAGQPWSSPLVAGEVITTGTLTSLPFIHAGESYHVDVEGSPLNGLILELCS